MNIDLNNAQRKWIKEYLKCQKTYHLKEVGADIILMAESCLNSNILCELPPYHLTHEPSEPRDYALVPTKISLATQKQARAEVGKILKEMRREHSCSRRNRILWLAQGLKWDSKIEKLALRNEYLNLVSFFESSLDSKIVHYICNQGLTLSQTFDLIRENGAELTQKSIDKFKHYNRVS